MSTKQIWEKGTLLRVVQISTGEIAPHVEVIFHPGALVCFEGMAADGKTVRTRIMDTLTGKKGFVAWIPQECLELA